MSTLRRIALTATSFLLFGCVIRAQQAAPEKAATPAPAPSRAISMSGRFAAPPAHMAVITGAPYYAEEMSDHTQTLADGTHLTQKTLTVKICRDSEGRTRRERIMGPNNASDAVIIAEISDPVSGFRYLLDPYNRIAHRFSAPEKASEPARYSQETRALPQVTTPVATPQLVKPAPVQENRPEHITESLGTQVLEGILVEGKRTTTTFPVGLMGNDRPIVRVMESWFSPDLKITLLLKDSDPRMGDHTMRLQNIERTEPDPALFRVPPDYQVIDENGDQAEIKINRP
jgi:hypothetical protein